MNCDDDDEYDDYYYISSGGSSSSSRQNIYNADYVFILVELSKLRKKKIIKI